MFETLRKWLNGPRDYFTGVVLLQSFCKDVQYIALLKSSDMPRNKTRLLTSIEEEYERLKREATPEIKKAQPPKAAPLKPASDPYPKENITQAYLDAKNRADKAYKEAMNARAFLFESVRSLDEFKDLNTPELIAARAPHALRTVQLYSEASKLYEIADAVAVSGKASVKEDEGGHYDHLEDHLVKPTIDRLRNNLGRLKKKDPTPDRMALIGQYEADLLKLLERWHLLKPTE